MGYLDKYKNKEKRKSYLREYMKIYRGKKEDNFYLENRNNLNLNIFEITNQEKDYLRQKVFNSLGVVK